MTKRAKALDISEYVVLFNENFPTSPRLTEVEYAAFDTEWEAGNYLINLLNKAYPGKWRPCDVTVADLRFEHVDSVGMVLLLGMVEKRSAKIYTLIKQRENIAQSVEYYRQNLEEDTRRLAQIDSQIAALKASAKEDGS